MISYIATRNCDSNGNWDTVMCHTSEQFNDILSKVCLLSQGA